MTALVGVSHVFDYCLFPESLIHSGCLSDQTSLDELDYNSNWNSLMLVVEKIETLNDHRFVFDINAHGSIITCERETVGNTLEAGNGVVDATAANYNFDKKIDHVFRACGLFLSQFSIDGLNATNLSCNDWIVVNAQRGYRYRAVSENRFVLEETRVLYSITGEKGIFRADIDLSNYSQDKMFDDVVNYGPSFDEMCSWLDAGVNLPLIAQCIFESIEEGD